LLTDRAAIDNAAASTDTVPVDSLALVSPVTTPCRVVAQMTNFASHVKDAGMDPKTIPLTFFRKSSASITGPFGDIVKPAHVQFLDYEVEIGLIVGRDVPVGTALSEANLAEYVAGLVVTNDVSARDIQLPQTQFYEAKSYPTFTPVGPWLTLVDAAELARLRSLRLTLRVNGQVRQDSTAADMIVAPARALTLLSRFQPMAPGDLLLTGTPGGTALRAPSKTAGKLAALLPPATRWKLFFSREARNPRYLHDGDVITAAIASPDGRLDLGSQRTTVIGKTP
jgi:2-keto-4-pentenoate hydratase/2-oxohepta-3-ene-1,7-dioic acid hydratase in catechol pathway